MSITISIRSSESGKPQPKPGMAGAFGATEPEGSLDNSVEIFIDEGHQVSDLGEVLSSAAAVAATAFSHSFGDANKGATESDSAFAQRVIDLLEKSRAEGGI